MNAGGFNHLRSIILGFTKATNVLFTICIVTYSLAGQDIEAILLEAAPLPKEEREEFVQNKIKEHLIANRLKEFSKIVEREYTPFFLKMGLTKEENATFKKARVDLLRLAIEDGDPRQEFFNQRHAYDLDVRASINKQLAFRFDRHILTKRNPHTVQASIWSENNDEAYETLYTICGIPNDHIKNFQDNRKSIYKMAQDLRGPRESLIQAREDYLSKLNQIAGKKAFATYREWELTKQAQRVFELFKNRTSKVNMGLLKQYEAVLVDLFRESNVQLSLDWHCPFGTLPCPVVGQQLLGIQAERDLEQLTNSKEAFFAIAPSYQLPAPLILELHGFFLEEMNHLQVQIDAGKEPEKKVVPQSFE